MVLMMESAHGTDIGKKRKINQDIAFARRERGIFLLADGMGGHAAGEVASAIAVEEAFAYLDKGLDRSLTPKDMANLLKDSVIRAHNAIKRKAQSDESLADMGTTLVELIIKGADAYVCHVGDSRAYVLRDELSLITADHTIDFSIRDYLNRSAPKEPARRSHMLTQAVGVSDEPVPEIHHVELMKHDLFLLCSDGLTDMLTDQAIYRIAREFSGNLEKAVHELIAEANRKGGRDNISVILVRAD